VISRLAHPQKSGVKAATYTFVRPAHVPRHRRNWLLVLPLVGLCSFVAGRKGPDLVRLHR